MPPNMHSHRQLLISKCDVSGCIICIESDVEYLDKKLSEKNSTKDVIL